jgi:hypothetical protein
MKLADIIVLVRDVVNDQNTKYWTNVEIGRWVNQWVRSIFRDRVDADASYGMYRYDVLASQTTRWEQLYATTFAYFLPSWVYKVRSVELLEGTATTNKRGVFIPPLVPHINQPSYGWEFGDNRRLMIHGWGQAEDIRIHCAKIPTLIHTGTIASSGAADGSTIIVSATNANSYPVDHEENAFINATFEITNQAAGRDTTTQRAVVTSVSKSTGSLPFLYTLTVKPIIGVQVNIADTYDMHAELDDAHIPYLVLRVAESLFHRANNTAGIEAITSDLRREYAAFKEGIQPRTDNVIHRIRDPEDPLLRTDPDRDLAYNHWWGV